jgi:NHL repeat
VRTLAGADLFEFGDTDGQGNEVRLQHPLGVLSVGEEILIADTYNHKIKELNPAKRTVKTVLGTGKPGQKDGRSPSFHEPSGLSVANEKLYIADANNHAIRVVDLETKETYTLNIKGLEPPVASPLISAAEPVGPNAEELKFAAQRLRAGNDGSLLVNVDLPVGYHLNPAAPHRYKISVEAGADVLQVVADSTRKIQLPLRVGLRPRVEGEAQLRIQMTLYYCREDNTGTCRIKTLVFRVPVAVTHGPDASSEVKVQGVVAEK